MGPGLDTTPCMPALVSLHVAPTSATRSRHTYRRREAHESLQASVLKPLARGRSHHRSLPTIRVFGRPIAPREYIISAGQLFHLTSWLESPTTRGLFNW